MQCGECTVQCGEGTVKCGECTVQCGKCTVQCGECTVQFFVHKAEGETEEAAPRLGPDTGAQYNRGLPYNPNLSIKILPPIFVCNRAAMFGPPRQTVKLTLQLHTCTALGTALGTALCIVLCSVYCTV